MIHRQYVKQIILQRDLVKSFEEFPFSLPAIRMLYELEIHPHVTCFVGENGTGKSTLLEAIAVSMGFNPEGGTRNLSFTTRASHSDLHRYIRVSRGTKRMRDGFFLRAESFFNVATEIDRLDQEPGGGAKIISSYGGRSLHEQSHGESFLALMMNRFSGQGLYILDEPEAALSPLRQLAILRRMHDLIKRDSQFIIATHSPILMAYPEAWIYLCSPTGIHRIDYRESEHFQVMHDFLVNPQRMLDTLFED